MEVGDRQLERHHAPRNPAPLLPGRLARFIRHGAKTLKEQKRMPGYKLLTYQAASGPRAGVLVNDTVHDAAELTGQAGDATVLGILEDWASAQKRLRDAAGKADGGKGQPLTNVKLRAPILWPSTIYCAGANYADHVLEMAKRHNRPVEPDPHTLGLKAWHFIKAARSIADPDATIAVSHYSQQMDWEVELAAVIGRPAKDVPEERALDYVAGYTIANDLSARDQGRRPHISDTSPFKADWTRHKSFDGSCPLGPWITPAEFIRDPHDLAMKLWVNDVIKQDSNSGQMIFNIKEQIARLSTSMTLHPGDLILTGTPAGVGAGRGEFLKAGDTVKIWIEEIGELSNRFS
jgi:2-keto-4-pentenoate hydratase/2-oxohepta-3-ene-1,7-dioic acid hydratase in catechol pathway